MKRLHFHPILLLLAMLTLAACSLLPQEFGTLGGQVTIGPLVPVVREGEAEPTPAPEVFAAREIVVYNKKGNREVTRLEIDASGWYQGELPVGVYVVDINRIGIDSAAGLPTQIEIKSDQVTRLDVDIDTGIR